MSSIVQSTQINSVDEYLQHPSYGERSKMLAEYEKIYDTAARRWGNVYCATGNDLLNALIVSVAIATAFGLGVSGFKNAAWGVGLGIPLGMLVVVLPTSEFGRFLSITYGKMQQAIKNEQNLRQELHKDTPLKQKIDEFIKANASLKVDIMPDITELTAKWIDLKNRHEDSKAQNVLITMRTLAGTNHN